MEGLSLTWPWCQSLAVEVSSMWPPMETVHWQSGDLTVDFSTGPQDPIFLGLRLSVQHTSNQKGLVLNPARMSTVFLICGSKLAVEGSIMLAAHNNRSLVVWGSASESGRLDFDHGFYNSCTYSDDQSPLCRCREARDYTELSRLDPQLSIRLIF